MSSAVYYSPNGRGQYVSFTSIPPSGSCEAAWPELREGQFVGYEPRPIPEDQIPLNDYGNSTTLVTLQSSRAQSPFSILAWWLPELFASTLSCASFLVIVWLLRMYDGRAVKELRLPQYLTLNGIIAAIATLNRAFLLMPIGSAFMQELWLYFADEAQKANCLSRLRDLEVFDNASRGVWGSLWLLFRFRGRR